MWEQKLPHICNIVFLTEIFQIKRDITNIIMKVSVTCAVRNSKTIVFIFNIYKGPVKQKVIIQFNFKKQTKCIAEK